MGHIGNTVQTAFTTFDKQTITGTGGTTYTLTHSVANEQEIEVFVNNVRQEGGSGKAYTVSGNQITFSENIASTDTVYVNFQGKAVQTVSHPSNAPLQATTGTFSSNVDVGGSLLVDTIKEGTGTNTAMTIDSNGRVGFSNPILVQAYKTTTQTSAGIMIWNNEVIDTANAYDPTTGQFTCPKAGYYEVSFNYLARSVSSGHRTNVRKNGVKQGVDSSNSLSSLVWSTFPSGSEVNISASTIVECAANDELDVHLTYLGVGDIYGNANAHNNMTIKFLG